MRICRTGIALAALLLVASGSPALAAAADAPTKATPMPTDGWRHVVALYGWGAGMSGTGDIGPVEGDVDVSFSEIVEDLEMAGMMAYRGENDHWAIMGNVVYVGLGSAKDLPLGGVADVDLDQWIVEVDGAFRFSERFEVLFGLRGYELDLAVEVRSPLGATASGEAGKNWVDPVIGARYKLPMGKAWDFVVRGDVGGFGIGSELSWQAVTHFDWRASKNVGMSVGYLLLDVDYEDGEGADEFLYDMAIQGPFLALVLSF